MSIKGKKDISMTLKAYADSGAEIEMTESVTE